MSITKRYFTSLFNDPLVGLVDLLHRDELDVRHEWCSAQKSSISWVSLIPPMSEPASERPLVSNEKTFNDSGSTGAPTLTMTPSAASSDKYRSRSISALTVFRTTSNEPASRVNVVRVAGVVISGQRQTACRLSAFQRLRQNTDFGTELVGEFDAQVAEPGQTDDRNPGARADAGTRSGEYVVIPAHSRGAASARSMSSGIFTTKSSVVTMSLEYPPWVIYLSRPTDAYVKTRPSCSTALARHGSSHTLCTSRPCSPPPRGHRPHAW